MSRRRPLAAALVACAAAGLLAAPSAGAADKVLNGNLRGADGRAVSALLGFDLKDDEGRTLGASGCVRSPSCPVDGYAITRRINFELGATGAPVSERWVDDWRVTLPEEAARVYVDVYPQGRRYAGTDTTRYVPSFRRNVPVPFPGTLNLRLPLACEPAGGGEGEAGYVNGYATEGDSGRRVPLRRITAFSMEADNNRPTPVLGFGTGRTESNGFFRIDDLAAGAPLGQPDERGQRYQLIATAADGEVRRVYGVRVTPCEGTTVNIRF